MKDNVKIKFDYYVVFVSCFSTNWHKLFFFEGDWNMKNFKGFVLLSALGLFLGACDTADSSEKDDAVELSKGSTSIKDIAIAPEYGQMYNEELDLGTHVHIVGELGEISESPENTAFVMASLSKDETEMCFYNIENYTSNNSAFKFSENVMVDIWGTYQGNEIIRAFVIETNYTAKRVSETINEFLSTPASQMKGNSTLSQEDDSINEYHANIEGIALFDDKIYEEIMSKTNLTTDEITSILESNLLLTETIIEVSKVDNETQISIDSTDPKWIEFIKGDAAGSVKSNKQIWANNIKKTCEQLKFVLGMEGFDIHIQIMNPIDSGIALRVSNSKSINYDIVTMTSIYDDEYDAIATECNRLYGEEVGQFIYNNDDKTYEVKLNNEMRDTVSQIRFSGNTQLAQSFIDIFIGLQDDIQDNLGSGYSLTALDYYYYDDNPIVIEVLDGEVVTDNLTYDVY